MILRRFSLFISFFIFYSCSIFIENLDGDILEENNVKPLSLSSKTTCEILDKDILISENKASQKTFNRLIQAISKEKPLSFVDKTVIWSLLQMNLRPDLSSPTAKLQALIKINGKVEYLNSYSEKDGAFAYLDGLNYLLKKYHSRYDLTKLGRLLDTHLSETLFVTKGFEDFLAGEKKNILKTPKLKKIFIRGDETLKENERIPKINFLKIVKSFQKKKIKSDLNKFLFSYKNNSAITPKCNFDMSLYKDSLFLINDTPIKSHIFGIKSGKNAFMAVSSQKLAGLSTINNSILLKGDPNVRSASICSFSNKSKPENALWLFSTNSRDPGQHLFHLMQYGLENIQNVNELNSMLMFSRHQFLKNPVRLIIESRRSSSAQLNELLKLNIPIYNSKKLGKVWGYYQDRSKTTFVLDDRRQGHLECSSN